jgi:hypothetical protein
MNELRSISTGLASSTLHLTLILVGCDQLVRAPHSHATTVHGDCKITVQFSHVFFFLLNRVIAKTRKVRSRITMVACIAYRLACYRCCFIFQNSMFSSPEYTLTVMGGIACALDNSREILGQNFKIIYKTLLPKFSQFKITI